MRYRFSGCKKVVKHTAGFLVAVASIGVFFSASVDTDPKQTFNFQQETLLKSAMLCLALLVGFNEYFEMIDHLGDWLDKPKTQGERQPLIVINDAAIHAEPLQVVLQDPSATSSEQPVQQRNSNRCIKRVLRAAAITTTVPFGLAAGYGLFTQGVSLMESFGIENPAAKNALAMLPTSILGAQFAAVQGAHVVHTILGTQAAFTQRATHTSGKNACFHSSKLALGLFVLFCATHLAESFLLSAEITQTWIYVIAIIALTVGRAVSHLDHALELPDTFSEWNKHPWWVKIVTGIIGTASGIAHASTGLLSTVYFWNKINTFGKIALIASDTVECVTGAGEYFQHGGQEIAQRLNPPRIPSQELPSDLPRYQH